MARAKRLQLHVLNDAKLAAGHLLHERQLVHAHVLRRRVRVSAMHGPTRAWAFTCIMLSCAFCWLVLTVRNRALAPPREYLLRI